MDQATIKNLSARFRTMMAERNARAAPIASASTRRDQILPHPFYTQVLNLSTHVHKYEKAGLLDKALDAIDLGKIYSEADENAERDSSLGYQDHLIKALLRWFKEEFFVWVNAPACSLCRAETEGIGMSQPGPEESRKGAGRVELYRCKADSQHIERFPRYDDLETLLTWRRGRCGEFANCFTLLCIALGSRARWVWNAEDHVWTEVYSDRLARWVHCDSCENAWDQPKIYSVGWGKKMSYCLAFSVSGAQDVTRRYVREPERSLPRNLGPEETLKTAVRAISQQSRSGLPKADVDALELEDAAEETELAGYIQKVIPTKPAEERPRESGNAEWKHARGEDGQQDHD